MNNTFLSLTVYIALLAVSSLFAGHVVFILGPSCSGKTTVSHKVARELGDAWKVVEYDKWEGYIGRRNAPATAIFERMIDDVHANLDAGYDVIVDANRYFPDQCVSLLHAGHQCTNVYLYAPFKLLIKRCKKRLKEHNHKKWSHSIRKFVKMTFKHFYPNDIPEQTDGVVIDTEQTPFDTVVTKIKAIICMWKLRAQSNAVVS